MKDDKYLDEALKRWIWAAARTNHWRVMAWYDLEDLVQDGFIVYCRCREKYVPLENKPHVDNQKQFMAFFKVCFMNHIIDLSKKRTRHPEWTPTDDVFAEGRQQDWLENLAEEEGISVSLLVSNAPPEVAQIFQMVPLISERESKFRKTRLHERVLPSGAVRLERGPAVRETTIERIIRLTGRADARELVMDYVYG